MRILLFIVLKIVEIGLFVFMPYGIGKLSNYFLNCIDDDEKLGMWLLGIATIIITIVITALLIVFIVANWELAKHILP